MIAKRWDAWTTRTKINAVNDDWPEIERRYQRWHYKVVIDKTTKTPTSQQAERAQYEYFLEQGMELPHHFRHMEATPLYRLVHGLPGAGKSQAVVNY